MILTFLAGALFMGGLRLMDFGQFAQGGFFWLVALLMARCACLKENAVTSQIREI